MTCKDCVHYDACRDMYDGSREDFDEITGFAPDCIDMGIFKNKADFVEVRHGEWTKKRYDIDCKMCVFTCSSCLYGCVHSYKDTPIFGYCPNCGARMKGMIISEN